MGEDERVDDVAKAGGADSSAGPRRSDPPSPSSTRRGRKRGEEPVDSGLQKLIQDVGRNKLGPDVSALEVYYSRSIRIRRLIAEFLTENEGTLWSNLPELHARAANYAGCSSPTSARWIHQFTRVGAPWRLVESVDHWLLDRRDGP
jgi:hypothetical protein